MEPTYYAVIPANVRYDSRLKANEKLLYGEITSLTNKYGYCYATNKYFADLYSVSQTSISSWIKNLINFGYLKSQLIYKDGTKEILNRYIRLVIDPIQENLHTPIQENCKDNNTSNNTKKNKESKNLILFSDCVYCDYKNLRDNLKTDLEFIKKYGPVDLKHYIFQVDAWSESSQTKRTERGWLMTLKKWMSNDLQSNKLVKLQPNPNKEQGHINF